MKKILTSAMLFLLFTSFGQNLGLDTSFGNNGFIVNNSSDSTPLNVYFENNKYFLINSTNSILSINYNGLPNTSFGNNGLLSFNNSNETLLVKGSKLWNGFFYIFGQVQYNSSSNKDFFIAKISTDGIVDFNFGSNGILRQDFGADEVINDVLITANGKILGIGSRIVTSSATLLVSCNSNGTIDTNLNNIGYKILENYPNEFSNGVKLFNFEENVLVVANSRYSSGSGIYNRNMTIMKIDFNGNYITSFGNSGVLQVPLQSTSDTGNTSITDGILLNSDELYFASYYSYSFITQSKTLKKYTISLNSVENLSNLPLFNTCYYIDTAHKIYFTGTERCSPNTVTNCARDFRIYKKNHDGTTDNTFNSIGSYSYNFFPLDLFSDDMSSLLYLHEDGKIFMAGRGYNPYSNGTGIEMLRITEVQLGLADIEIEDKVLVFPNPSNEVLNIFNHNVEIDFIKVYDIYGKQILFKSENIEKLDIRNLQNGMYFLQISSTNKLSNIKFIKSSNF